MSVPNHQTSNLIYPTQPPHVRDRRRKTPHVRLNWTLAVLTVPLAASAVIFAVSKAVSMAVCTSAPCPDPGPHPLVYTVLLYGAPLVAAATIIASIFTATRQRGVVVPLCGLAALLTDIVAAAILFRR
jgi:hypothetical protein